MFFSTYTLLSLHVWLVIHRLGSHTDRDSREFKQRFYENFQNDVERRVHRSVSVRGCHQIDARLLQLYGLRLLVLHSWAPLSPYLPLGQLDYRHLPVRA